MFKNIISSCTWSTPLLLQYDVCEHDHDRNICTNKSNIKIVQIEPRVYMLSPLYIKLNVYLTSESKQGGYGRV